MIWHDIVATPTRYVRVGEGGAIETNEDPNAWDNVWVTRSSGTAAILYGVAWNGARLVAVGAGGAMVASDDEGLTWYGVTSGVSTDLYAVANGGAMFITVGAQGVILVSEDGLSWELLDSSTFWDLWGVTVENAEYTAVGDNDVIVVGVLISLDKYPVVEEVLASNADLSSLGTFNMPADETVAVDERAHRGTLVYRPVLVAVTEHMGVEDQGDTDVGGAVESGFDETTTSLDAVVTESVWLDDVDQAQYQGDTAEQFFMCLNDEAALSSVQMTDQWVGNALTQDTAAINDRPFINNEPLSEVVALSTSLVGAYGKVALDEIGLSAAASAAAKLAALAADTVGLTDTVAPVGTITITMAESVALGDTVGLNQIINALVAEGVSFGVALTLDGESYLAWVMNTETVGLTNYENFRFNSMCGFGGAYYATDGDKVYLLGGDSDAGTGINAEFSTGATDFGSSFLKGMDRAYFGFSADGQMVLKVVTNEKVEDWYLLEHVPDGNGEARARIGKGLKAQFWRIKIANKAGADFSFDSIRLLPLTLQKRV